MTTILAFAAGFLAGVVATVVLLGHYILWTLRNDVAEPNPPRMGDMNDERRRP